MFITSNINYRENPHVTIKIGEGCPTSCVGCRFSDIYIKSTKFYEKEKVLSLINELDSKFEKRFDLLFGNIVTVFHPNILDFIDAGLKTGRKVRFQLDLDASGDIMNYLSEIDSKYGSENLYIQIAKNANSDSYDWPRKLLLFLKSIQKFKFNVCIDLFIDIEKEKNKLDKLISHFNVNKFNKNSFHIGKSIDVKFHDYSWSVDNKCKLIGNLKIKDCLQLGQISFSDNQSDVIISDNIEMLINGDIFIHDNLCNIGDNRVSNIYLSERTIFQHFVDYKDFLITINNRNSKQSKSCYECIKSNYSYKNKNG